MNPDIKTAFVNENRMKPESHQLFNFWLLGNIDSKNPAVFQILHNSAREGTLCTKILLGSSEFFSRQNGSWSCCISNIKTELYQKDNLREQPLPECMLQWRWGIHRQKKWGTLFFGDNL